MIERIIRYFRQRRCQHQYRKRWAREAGQYGGYVWRCTKCGKISHSKS